MRFFPSHDWRMTKPWKIVSTVLIAVLIPPGMAAWFVGYALIAERWLAPLSWNMSYWMPGWVSECFYIAIAMFWFGLPWVGIVWLLFKIWTRTRPRITEGKI